MTTNTNTNLNLSRTAVAERDAEALRLRNEGWTLADIGAELGFGRGTGTVSRAVRRAMERTSSPVADSARAAAAAAVGIADNDRQFGIEFECCVTSVDAAIAAITAAGVTIRDERRRAYTDSITNGGYSGWMVKYDCTVSPTAAQRNRGITTGVEIISPPLRGADGVDQVRKVSQALLSIGTAVNRSCGTHVHHDVNGETGDTVATFVEMYAANQDNLNRLVAPSRRGRRQYCGPLGSGAVANIAAALRRVDNVQRGTNVYAERYVNVNVNSLAKYGTVEVRQHHGTVDADKILAWVAVGQAMLTIARNADTAPARSRGITGLIADLAAGGLDDATATYLNDRVAALR